MPPRLLCLSEGKLWGWLVDECVPLQLVCRTCLEISINCTSHAAGVPAAAADWHWEWVCQCLRPLTLLGLPAGFAGGGGQHLA